MLSSPRRIALFVAAVLCLFVGQVSVASAQATAELQSAKEEFWDANFDAAVESLEAFVERSDLSKETRCEALLYLAKVQFARGHVDESRAALERLKLVDPEFEPPMREVIDIRQLYFDVFGAELSRKPGIYTITILDFTKDFVMGAESYDGFGRMMQHLFVNELVGAVNVQVVERERIDFILQELELSRQDLTDASTAAHVGKLLGAQSILMGSFSKPGKDDIIAQARLVETETSVIKKTWKFTIDADEPVDDIVEAALSLGKEIDAKLGESQTRRDRPGVDALRSYLDGLEYLDKRDFTSALEHFEEALAAYPEYTEVEEIILQVTPYLAQN